MRNKPKRKKPFYWQKGKIAQSVILIIVLVGAFYLVGGFASPSFLTDSQIPYDGIIDKDQNETSANSLQLNTIKFKQCSSVLTVNLLLDRSGSMNDRTPSNVTKIAKLKEAVLLLTGKLNDNSIVGIQSFSGTSITDDIPISYYRDVKTQIQSKVNSLTASGNTPTNTALKFSLGKLKEGILKFPNRNFNFIFISDGAPVPITEDPRLPANAPNPADEIKALGVEIYTIGIYSQSQAIDQNLKQLLINIASSPQNYYEAPTGDEVAGLLSQISNKICEGEQKENDNLFQ